jgi:hypothetical protein
MYNLNGNVVGAGTNLTITRVEFLGGDVVVTFVDSSGNVKTIKQQYYDNMVIATSVVIN